MFPPMFPMMYPPPPPRRSFARGIFVSLATTIFGLSLLANIYLLVFSGIFSASGMTEAVVKEGSTDKVAIIPIHGIVDSGMASQVKEWIKKVDKDKDVKAIVLDVDSPGGTITASDEIYHWIGQLKKERGLKVAVSMGGLGASGAYYISCTGDRLFAQPTTLTGSIGVIAEKWNFSELASKWGLKDTSQTAPPPPDTYKDAGSMFRPETKRDQDYFQSLIDQAYAQFTGIVKDSRKANLKGQDSELFNGRIFTADEAEKNGLIDQKGYIEDACNWVAQSAGLSSPTIVRYQRRATLVDLFLSTSAGNAPDRRAAANGNVNITIDSKLIDELTTPRLQYLWKGQ
jgi:protease-4